MKLHLHLFAGLAEKIGHSEITFSIEQHEMTVGQLKEHISSAYPHASEIIKLSFVAKNQTYALPEEPVCETDELALIPPVSGGEPKDPAIIRNAVHSVSRYSISNEPL